MNAVMNPQEGLYGALLEEPRAYASDEVTQ